MKKPAIKPSQRINHTGKSHIDWKENRLVVAVLSAAGTATLFSTVIMPLVNTVQSNKIQQFEELTKNAKATSDELEKIKEKLRNAEAEVALAIEKTPFVPGSVYPLGHKLDSVILGMDIQELKIRLSLEEDEAEEEDGMPIKMRSYKTPNHTVFHSAAYFLSNNKVQTILYHLNDGDRGAALLSKVLLTNFGEPFAQKKGSMLWKIKNNEWAIIEHDKKTGYAYSITNQPSSRYWGEFLKKGKDN